MSDTYVTRKVVASFCDTEPNLILGQAGDVNCTELQFIIDPSYTNEYSYLIVYDRADGSTLITQNGEFSEEKISGIVPPEITETSDGKGYSGYVQLFIKKEEGGEVVYLATSKLQPYIINDSLKPEEEE